MRSYSICCRHYTIILSEPSTHIAVSSRIILSLSRLEFEPGVAVAIVTLDGITVHPHLGQAQIHARGISKVLPRPSNQRNHVQTFDLNVHRRRPLREVATAAVAITPSMHY